MKFFASTRWLACGLLALTAACSSQPPPAQWATESLTASERAVQAYLKGQPRAAQAEWRKAFQETAATGSPVHMARMALLECAAQLAALEMGDCPRFERYAAGAAPAELAYARYVRAQAQAGDIALLPAAQQAVARQLLAGQLLQQLPADAPPLSQLTAAAVALRAGQLAPALIAQAADLAAAQGWRRAAMAWLLLQQRALAESGDAAALEAVALRLRILEEEGAAEGAKK